jgi:Family of unknown function (DUF6463)
MNKPTPRPWIGRWLIVVAIIHTVFGLLVFHSPLHQIVQTGWWGGIERDPMLSAVTWFMLFGFPLLVAGIALHAVERTPAAIPVAIAWWLLAGTGLGVALMPTSGFYLLLPPALVLLRRHYSPPAASAAP